MSTFLRRTGPVVFLRPNPFSVRTVQRVDRVTGAFTSMPQQQLAIFTCKLGPNQGPKGDRGEDQNSWWDTIIAAAGDEINPISVGLKPKYTYRAPYPFDLTLGYARMSLTEAPIGADFIVDVHCNGVSIFAPGKLLTIDDGMDTSVGSTSPYELAITYIPDDAKLEIIVTQVGIMNTGVGLKTAVTGIKAP